MASRVRTMTTPATRSTESTIPPAMCAGRNDATCTAFVNALATKEIDPQPLIAGIYPLVDAPNVYEQLSDGSLQGVGFLFEYDGPKESEPITARSATGRTLPPAARTREPNSRTRRPVTGSAKQRTSAGRLRRCRELCVVHVASASRQKPGRGTGTGRDAPVALSRQRPAEVRIRGMGTDADAVIEDSSLDAVFIVTRHSSHAELTCRALEAGKAVFVEKPLALSGEELDRVLADGGCDANDRSWSASTAGTPRSWSRCADGSGPRPSRRTRATW